MESVEQMSKIARLEEEKSLLWEIISDLETWMFGEGCFISERTKAKIEMARAVASYVDPEPIRKTGRPANPKKQSAGWTLEKRQAAAERCRVRMLAIHAERRMQRANEKELSSGD
jgi:hypothetical protein